MLLYAWMLFVETAPERYDLGMKIMTLGRIDRIKKIIADRIKPGDKILDIGCGTGTLAVRCMKKGAYVTGIDSSEFMLEQAMKNAKASGLEEKLTVIKDSATQIDKHFENETFNYVIATCSLGEFPKSYLEYIFKRVNKLLKKNGKIIIADEMQPEGKWRRLFYNIIMGILWIPQFLIVRRVAYPIKGLPEIIENSGATITERIKLSLTKIQILFAEKVN
ncbi:MAG: class I SAM-dependent methyltransferase [Desulfobacteraceae bacterium]|nr:class I SAM-dependent methyltransferase [Desulfobacteraceae bacterium]